VDARPKANATANKTRGGGYEILNTYDNCQIYFMGIDNIHKMRESRNALFDLVNRGKR